MCNHEHIVVAHYGFHVEGEVGDRKACVVRCADCDKKLFRSNSLGVKIAYDYIDKNRFNFKTLADLTCDELNKKYGIADGFNRK